MAEWQSSTRGWRDAYQAKPAAAYEIRYGDGLLAAESREWPPYLLVTSPSAQREAEPHLVAPPRGVTQIRTLDAEYLQRVADELPDDAALVVGLGGGQALDAAKYISMAKDCPLVQVPTIVSTGAITHSYCATFHGRTIVGSRADWVWSDPEYVLVDTGLVLSAPDHLNTAGLGDVLCEYSGRAEWQRRRRLGLTTEESIPGMEELAAFHVQIVDEFPRTLDADGRLTAESVRFIMQTIQARDSRRVQHPDAPNADHAFLFALEAANDRSWIHGELAALGTLTIAWRCEEGAAKFASWLDRCRVRRRPSEQGVAPQQLRRGLEYLTQTLEKQPDAAEFRSVLRSSPIMDDLFPALWDFLEA